MENNELIGKKKFRGEVKEYRGSGYKGVDVKKSDVKKEAKLKKLSMIGKRPRRKVEKSQKQKLVEEIMKSSKALKNTDDMAVFLKSKNFDVNDNEVKYYFNLYNMKFLSKRIVLPSNLITKPIIIPYLCSFKSSLLTTDSLFWQYYFVNYVIKDNNNVNKKLIGSVSLEDLSIDSVNVIYEENKKEFKEYYLQDFDENISCPGLDPSLKIEKGNFKSRNNEKFVVNNVIYNVYYVDVNESEYLCIAKQDINVENVIEKLNNAKKIESKHVLSNGVRILNKNKGYYYYSQRIKPTNFCPSCLELSSNNPVEFKVVFYLRLDPNKYVNDVLTSKKLIKYTSLNMVSLNNLDLYIKLFVVIFLTFKDLDKTDGDSIEAMYKMYNEYRSVFVEYKRLYNTFKRIVLDYYDVFSSRVNVDKIQNILLKCNLYIEEFTELEQSSVFSDQERKLLDYFKDISFTWKNWLLSTGDNSSLSIIKVIRLVCIKLTNPASDSNELESNVRASGVVLQKIFVDGDIPMIDETRSPSAFLTNTVGEDMNVIKNVIVKLKRKIEEQVFNDENIVKEQIMGANYLNNKIQESLNTMGQNNNQLKNVLDVVKNNIVNILNSMKQSNININSIMEDESTS